MTLKREGIAESVSTLANLSEANATRVLKSIPELILKSLEDGEGILISGFGKFCVRTKSHRKGTNPTTGDRMMLGARRVLTLKSSPVLREKVNTENCGPHSCMQSIKQERLGRLFEDLTKIGDQ